MKILLLFAAATACVAAPRLAAAADPATPPLQLKPKALVALASAPAPFTAAPVEDHQLDLAPHSAPHSASPSACGVESNVCWDASDGRIVYKPARRFMPSLPGFTPESVSVRRDRIVFRYSF